MNRAQSLSTWMPAPFVAFNSIEICSEFQGWARKENNPNNLKPGSSKQLNKSSWSFLVIVNKLPVNPSGRPWSRQMLTFVPISRNKLRGIILMCLKLQGLCTFQAMAHFQLVAHRVRTKSHLHHLVCLTHWHSNATRTAAAVAVQNLPQEKLTPFGWNLDTTEVERSFAINLDGQEATYSGSWTEPAPLLKGAGLFFSLRSRRVVCCHHACTHCCFSLPNSEVRRKIRNAKPATLHQADARPIKWQAAHEGFCRIKSTKLSTFQYVE